MVYAGKTITIIINIVDGKVWGYLEERKKFK